MVGNNPKNSKEYMRDIRQLFLRYRRAVRRYAVHTCQENRDIYRTGDLIKAVHEHARILEQYTGTYCNIVNDAEHERNRYYDYRFRTNR